MNVYALFIDVDASFERATSKVYITMTPSDISVPDVVMFEEKIIKSVFISYSHAIFTALDRYCTLSERNEHIIEDAIASFVSNEAINIYDIANCIREADGELTSRCQRTQDDYVRATLSGNDTFPQNKYKAFRALEQGGFFANIRRNVSLVYTHMHRPFSTLITHYNYEGAQRHT